MKVTHYLSRLEYEKQKNIAKVYSQCDSTCHGGCYHGTMEAYLKADDPFYPCNALEQQYQSLCWQYQSSYFALLTQQDFNKVAEMCLKIPKNYQDNYFKTIGTNQVGFTSQKEKMWDNCSTMPSVHFQNICVTGVISSMAYRFVGDTFKMIDFCSIVDRENKESYYKQMGTSLLDWNNDKNLAFEECNKIPNPNVTSWCISSVDKSTL